MTWGVKLHNAFEAEFAALERTSIVLVAGDKSGGSQKRFYKQLIAKADSRISAHLQNLKAVKKG